MIAFYREYADYASNLPRAVAELDASAALARLAKDSVSKTKMPIGAEQSGFQGILPQLVAKIPWGHNILLMEKIKDLPNRLWYVQQTIEQGWSRDTLALMIKSGAHGRQGKAVSNFQERLPEPQSDLAQQALKDPYVFDFLTRSEPFLERELEVGLVRHLEKFLIELGQGFAFVGRQYRIEIGDKDYYLDLLFYHLKLRSFVVIDLKKGNFKPEYAGKMNFYCSMVDDRLKHETDQPTIGLILCQTQDRILAEYALRDIHKPIGVSEYELTRLLPENLKSELPTLEEIEAELWDELADGGVESRE
jgi:predicted nuclease of restriction endonuclease-like (RecB) superfamily